MIRITKGLDLPIEGEPDQAIAIASQVGTVALVADDFVGMKPTMEVREGDTVKLGQVLFTDKKTGGLPYTSPGSGKVAAINRGAKRAFQSIVIELDGDDEVTFTSHQNDDISTLSRETVRDNLVASGLWTSLRTRPYSKVPNPTSVPHSIFVTAIDTNPLAANPEIVLKEHEQPFVLGMQALRRLMDGTTFLIKAAGASIPASDLAGIRVVEFAGPHPAGLPGTHIHFLDPVSEKKTVWYIGYQDVVAIGLLFMTGRLSVERIVSLAGPAVKTPRLLRTQLGACVGDLVQGELKGDDVRVISGSVLAGRQATGPFDYLGRYHLQVSAIAEGGKREFLGWQQPGFNKFSIKNVFASSFFGGGKRYSFDTSLEGSRRAMVPIGCFEKVVPMDVIPTFLLRALLVGDTAQAAALGCLELDEEDLALCTYVCPGKTEYGPILRKNLTAIEKEG